MRKQVNEKELMYTLIANAANVIMAVPDMRIMGKNNRNGLPLTIVDTFFVDEDGKISFSALVQLKTTSIEDFTFELVMMKNGTRKVLTLEEYKKDNIAANGGAHQFNEDGRLEIFDSDRFEYSFRFVHLFNAIHTMGLGKYALAVVVKTESGIEVVLDTYYFEVKAV